MTATYRTSVELDELRQAQTELERHLLSGPNGRCLTCGQFEPCYARTRAAATFRRYGQLPTRRPGLTLRHLNEWASAASNRFAFFRSTPWPRT